MRSYYLYQAPLPKQIISFPITLFDSTKSMNREYKSIIQTYEEVFNDFTETERQQYEWSKGIKMMNRFDINWMDPFSGVDYGNLTQSLSEIFNTLLTNQYPKYVAIILVTDGAEPLNSELLKQQIEEVKCKYFIQFISIIISDQPKRSQVQKKLKSLFKKEDDGVISQYIITRSQRKSILEIQNEFRVTFKNIKKQLVVYEQKDILNQEVMTVINESQLRNEIIPGSLFLAEKGQEIFTGNVKIQNTTQISHILQMLQSSFLNTLMKQSSKLTFQELQNECLEIQRVINDLLNQSNNDKNSEEYQVIQLILTIITSIINNTYSKDRQLFDDLYMAVSNPKVNQLKQLSLINQSEYCVQKINQINQQMISKLEKIIHTKKQLDLLKEQQNIILETLKIYIDIFSIDVKYIQDQKAYLKQFVQLLLNQLSILFQQQNKENEKPLYDIQLDQCEQLQQLFILNYIIKQLKQILMECQNEQFLISLNKLITDEILQNNKPKENIMIFYNSLNELPNLQQLNNTDNQDSQSIFVLLINMNEVMKIDFENLMKSYNEGFKGISNCKKIEIIYTNKNENNEKISQECYLLNQQSQKFNSLIELFEIYTEQYQLKQKKINICILTDDDQNYWKLHLQIKTLQQFQYQVKLIYIALGLGFYIFISNEIEQIEKQQPLFKKPFLSNIPKNRLIQNQKQKYFDKFQQKIFEEIAKKFKDNKL